LRRFFTIGLVVAALAVLAASGFLAWIGPEGGLTPVEPASPNAEGIQDLYVIAGAIATFIFLVVTVPLVLFIIRFRNRDGDRHREGAQILGSSKLELMWTVVPVVFVLVLIVVTFVKLPGIESPPRAAGATDLRVRVEGRLFYWRFVYPNGAVAIDELRLPVNRTVRLEITAPENDVIHSFWVPALGGKRDANPGKVNVLELKPVKLGTFEGKCAELCGIQHGLMLLSARVVPQAAFDSWVERTAQAQRGTSTALGKTFFERVCAKCHFAAPEFAPNIAANSLLGNEVAIRRIVTQGTGRMPPVAQGWPERELRSLVAYLKTIAPKEGQ
jgi:cytochrome c oxidase subunit 2